MRNIPTFQAAAFEATRRKTLRMFSLLLLLPVRAQALGYDDLLLPQNIGKVNAAPSGGTASTGNDQLAGLSPTIGRTEASNAVSAVSGLASAVDKIVRDMRDLDARYDADNQRYRSLIQERDAKIAEYRAGLFCSGCGRTKSEILARGESFPHPGQTIVRPTSQQIAEKERELQGPINDLKDRLENIRDKLSKLRNERDEGLDQIDWGILYWQTGCSYQTRILDMQLQAMSSQYKSRRNEISNLLTQLDHDIYQLQVQLKANTSAKVKEAVAQLQADTKLWARKLADMDKDYQARRTALDSTLQEARRRSDADAKSLNQALALPDLSRVLSRVVRPAELSPYAMPNSLGVKFRLGDYNPSRSQEELAAVQRFIGQFKALSNLGTIASSYSSDASASPPQRTRISQQLLTDFPEESIGESVQNKLKSKIREYLQEQCTLNPSDCTPLRPSGNGIRD